MAIKTLMKRLRARLRPAVSPHGTGSTRPFLTSGVSAVVDFCVGRPWWILSNELISPQLSWAKRALQHMREFPRFGIIVVIDAPTPEFAERVSTDLTRALLTQPERFRAISHPGSGQFFQRNGLLFLPTHEVARFTDGARQADALIATLVEDPSLRGILDGLSMVFIGVTKGIVGFDDLARPLMTAADTLETVEDNRPASFSRRAWAS